MKRILFVDDEDAILQGLKRTLRVHREEWEMVFVAGGEEALAEAAKAPFDVLVSDMRMPGMDGSKLLERFHEAHPETVRFMLSGHAESENVMLALPVAHQYLSKPCQPDALQGVVRRACELQALLSDDAARELIGTMDTLPARPTTYSAITKALADAEVSIDEVSAIIEADTAMSAKVLQLVNSGFFGLGQRITSVGHAARYLGLKTLRDLVLTIEVFRRPEGSEASLDAFLEELQRRLTWTAAVARKVAEDKATADEAFTAGLLHDIGMFVLATRLPEEFSGVLEKVAAGESFESAEQALLGASHAVVGGYMLGVWGLPYSISEVAVHHHRPSEIEREGFDALGAVHVAGALVGAKMTETGSRFVGPTPIDLEYLGRYDKQDQIEAWEELVEDSGEAEQ